MSTGTETAVILDFAAYRAKRAERARQAFAAPRRFLWGWPGQMMLVDFQVQRQPLSTALTARSPQAPGG